MSYQSTKQMYDDIVQDYEATKTACFQFKHEEPKLWSVIGDVKDLKVLDLACGSGYYAKKFKKKGAKDVVGGEEGERILTCNRPQILPFADIIS